MRSVFDSVLAECDGNKTEAGIRIARSLMEGDPASFKAGYTAPNAALAVRQLYDLTDMEYQSVLRAVSTDREEK